MFSGRSAVEYLRPDVGEGRELADSAHRIVLALDLEEAEVRTKWTWVSYLPCARWMAPECHRLHGVDEELWDANRPRPLAS